MNNYSLPNVDLVTLQTCESTNTHAADLIKSGRLVRDTLIIAQSQTAGKGRNGRAFFSPDGGIYMTLALKSPPKPLHLLTPAAAVAVCRAVKEISRTQCGIKWVNDIEIDGKKLCGILCEGIENHAVIGIGLNFLQAAPFPAEIAQKACALYTSPPDFPKELLIFQIAEQLLAIIGAFPSRDFVAEYRSRSVSIGQKITVHTPTGSYPAQALDIDDDCRLIVQTAEKGKTALFSGEISIRREQSGAIAPAQ